MRLPIFTCVCVYLFQFLLRCSEQPIWIKRMKHCVLLDKNSDFSTNGYRVILTASISLKNTIIIHPKYGLFRLYCDCVSYLLELPVICTVTCFHFIERLVLFKWPKFARFNYKTPSEHNYLLLLLMLSPFVELRVHMHITPISANIQFDSTEMNQYFY